MLARTPFVLLAALGLMTACARPLSSGDDASLAGPNRDDDDVESDSEDDDGPTAEGSNKKDKASPPGSKETGDDAETPPPPRCDLAKPFKAATDVPGVAKAARSASLTSDELTVVFARDSDLYVATRPDIGAPFGSAQPVTELNTTVQEDSPSITADGLTIYFRRSADGLDGAIYKASRVSQTARFGTPIRVLEDASPQFHFDPFVSADGQTLVYTRNTELWMKVGTSNASLDAVNVREEDRHPVLSADGLTLVFSSKREVSPGARYTFWLSKRASRGSSFGEPVKLVFDAEKPAPWGYYPTWLSHDGCALYFTDDVVSGRKLMVAMRPR